MLGVLRGLSIRWNRLVSGLPWRPYSDRVIHRGSRVYWASAPPKQFLLWVTHDWAKSRLERAGPCGLSLAGNHVIAWVVLQAISSGGRTDRGLVEYAVRSVRLQEAAHDRLGLGGRERTPAGILMSEMRSTCLLQLIASGAITQRLASDALAVLPRLDLFRRPGLALLPPAPPPTTATLPDGNVWPDGDDIEVVRSGIERTRWYRYVSAALLGLLLAPGAPLLRAAPGWFREPDDARSKQTFRLLELAATAGASAVVVSQLEIELRDYLRPAEIESEYPHWTGYDALIRAFEWALILSRARTGRIDVDWAARFLLDVE